MNQEASGAWHYDSPKPTGSCSYLWPVLKRVIEEIELPDRRAFDLGCGNGATADFLSKLGFDVTGIDISESGITQANTHFPHVRCEVGSAYDDLASRFGTFPLVVSLEVIEHCFSPHAFAKTFFSLIEPGGVGFLSTPYHGYWKNLTIALFAKSDWHFGALNEGGHIKFFSEQSLGRLLRQAGANQVRFIRVGRIPPLAKSMVAVVGP